MFARDVMVAKRCNYCGSNSLIADRSLAGRIICNDCGTPYGVKVYKNKHRNVKSITRIWNLNIYILLLFMVILLVIIL